jgi:cation transport regulator ChaC
MSARRFFERLAWSTRDITRFFESTMPERCTILNFVVAFNRLDPVTMNGQANLVPGQAPTCEGVLYRLTPEQLEFLDRSESGYRRQMVKVRTMDDRTVDAHAYVALETRSGLKPSRSYMELVLGGAREHDLSPDYIHYLERVETAADAADVVAALQLHVEGTSRLTGSAAH